MRLQGSSKGGHKVRIDKEIQGKGNTSTHELPQAPWMHIAWRSRSWTFFIATKSVPNYVSTTWASYIADVAAMRSWRFGTASNSLAARSWVADSIGRAWLANKVRVWPQDGCDSPINYLCFRSSQSSCPTSSSSWASTMAISMICNPDPSKHQVIRFDVAVGDLMMVHKSEPLN